MRVSVYSLHNQSFDAQLIVEKLQDIVGLFLASNIYHWFSPFVNEMTHHASAPLFLKLLL